VPYLKITSPDLNHEVRQPIALTLTEAVVRLNATSHITTAERRERCTVHFIPYAPDCMTIGGVLLGERGEPDVTVEYSDWSLSHRKQRRLARALTSLLAELFGTQAACCSRPEYRPCAQGRGWLKHGNPRGDLAVGCMAG
jgi:hypothetical protein